MSVLSSQFPVLSGRLYEGRETGNAPAAQFWACSGRYHTIELSLLVHSSLAGCDPVGFPASFTRMAIGMCSFGTASVRRYFSALLVIALHGFLAIPGQAQTPDPEPNATGNKPVPTITFDLAFPAYSPAHYAIAVESSGRASYRSDDLNSTKTDKNALLDPYTLEFTMSPATTERIFKFAKEANYFHGDFDYTKTRIANTGTKTLSYSEGPADSVGGANAGKHGQTSYNYSENSAIKELTSTFQAIGQTVEMGRRIAYQRRFDKLGLDATLKSAVELTDSGFMQELQIIAPALRAIVNDYAVMHIARQRAEHLLKTAGQF